MPRVMPSEIVRLIDRFYPAWAAGANEPQTRLGYDNAGEVSAILSLVDRLPQELVPLAPDQFADLVANLEILRSQNHMAVARGANHTYRGVAVWRLRSLLAACPDEAAHAAVRELRFIRNRALRDSLRPDISESYQSLNEGRWKAATVLAGSVMEALLVWRLGNLPAPIRNAAVARAIANANHRPQGNPDTWKLWQLVRVAQVQGLITPNTGIQADLARNFRNLIHPGALVRTGEQCSKATALGALAGMELVIEDLS